MSSRNKYVEMMMNSLSDQTKTDLYGYLVANRETLIERIAGTEGKWQQHWRTELAATQRALWSLTNQA